MQESGFSYPVLESSGDQKHGGHQKPNQDHFSCRLQSVRHCTENKATNLRPETMCIGNEIKHFAEDTNLKHTREEGSRTD